MALVAEEAKRDQNVTIVTGDEALEKAIELIESFGMPGGLLPLQDVLEAGVVEESGEVWIKQKKEIKHYFKRADKHVIYSTNISCKVENKKMKNVKGVKAKDMLMWVPIHEIVVDENTPPKIHFKSFGGLSRTFPVEYYARGQ
eukprot:Gb_20057 [translate_table: standard]